MKTFHTYVIVNLKIYPLLRWFHYIYVHNWECCQYCIITTQRRYHMKHLACVLCNQCYIILLYCISNDSTYIKLWIDFRRILLNLFSACIKFCVIKLVCASQSKCTGPDQLNTQVCIHIDPIQPPPSTPSPCMTLYHCRKVFKEETKKD